MKNLKKYLVAILSFFIGVGCFVTYSIIGSYVAEDGMLVEPFFLIPVGYLFLFSAVGSFLLVKFFHIVKKK